MHVCLPTAAGTGGGGWHAIDGGLGANTGTPQAGEVRRAVALGLRVRATHNHPVPLRAFLPFCGTGAFEDNQ